MNPPGRRNLRRGQRGKNVRLFQTPGAAPLAGRRMLSAPAGVLARRLQVGRDGLSV